MNGSLSTNNIRKVFMSLYPIQAFAVGLPAINALLDSFIIGNFIGTVGLTAVGFISPFIMLTNAIGTMISSGSQLMCGRAIGRADSQKICSIYTTSIIMCLVIGIPLTVATQLIPGKIALLLGAPEYLTEATDYIRGLGIGLVFMLLNSTILPYLQLDHSKKTSSAMIISMLLINTGGDFLSILVFDAGMYGAGFSTSLSFFVSVAIGASGLFKNKLFHFGIAELKVKTAGEICRYGFPDGFMFLCVVIRDRIANHYVFLYGGEIGISALSIANSLTTAFGNVVQAGYSGSARLISSVLVGQRDSKSLRELPKIMITSAGWMYVVLYALIFVFAGPLSLLLGAESSNIETYKMVVRLFNLWTIPIIFIEPVRSIYNGMGKTALITALLPLNIFVPWAVCAFLGKIFGLAAASCITWSVDIVTIIVFVIIFAVKAKRLPRSVFEFAYIPDSISAPRENCYQVTIQTINDAVKASEEIIDFCRSRSVSGKTAYYCGLCVEEMATDTIKHGFNKKDNTIDLRLIVEDGHVRILLRDTGREFSPIQWLALCNPEETERSIGIRMVSKLASEMNYVNSLGMNALTIVL